MFGTGLAIFLRSLPLLYLFYGVIGGIGLGTGYITPVSTLVKWFPEKRGFATGLAIMGFSIRLLLQKLMINYRRYPIIDHYCSKIAVFWLFARPQSGVGGGI